MAVVGHQRVCPWGDENPYFTRMLITGDHWRSLVVLKVGYLRLAASQLRDAKHAVSHMYCLPPTLVAVRKETLVDGCIGNGLE